MGALFVVNDDGDGHSTRGAYGVGKENLIGSLPVRIYKSNLVNDQIVGGNLILDTGPCIVTHINGKMSGSASISYTGTNRIFINTGARKVGSFTFGGVALVKDKDGHSLAALDDTWDALKVTNLDINSGTVWGVSVYFNATNHWRCLIQDYTFAMQDSNTGLAEYSFTGLTFPSTWITG
jgi:hypothetical protein